MTNFPRTKIARNPVWLYPPPEDCYYGWSAVHASKQFFPQLWQDKPFEQKMEWLQAQRGNLYQGAYRVSNGWKYTLGEAYFLIDVQPATTKWFAEAQSVRFEYLALSGFEKGKVRWFEIDVMFPMTEPWMLISKANDSEK